MTTRGRERGRRKEWRQWWREGQWESGREGGRRGMQGGKDVEEDAVALWSEAGQKLPPECLKFALNAVQDTLPHNAVWRRKDGPSSRCKLCGEPSHTF